LFTNAGSATGNAGLPLADMASRGPLVTLRSALRSFKAILQKTSTLQLSETNASEIPRFDRPEPFSWKPSYPKGARQRKSFTVIFFNRLTYPKLGYVKVAEIRFSDIAILHCSLRNTPITANRVIASLSTLFNWCERGGFRPRNSNPVQGVQRFEELSKERFLSPRELWRLGMAIARAERNKTESVFAIAAIRLLIFTGCRRNEILELQWKNVVVERAMFLLPETKTGRRPVYLSAPALSVLATLPWVSKNPYVWPAAGSVDTELRCLMELEACDGETEVQPRV
jgi:integrase